VERITAASHTCPMITMLVALIVHPRASLADAQPLLTLSVMHIVPLQTPLVTGNDK
jgi:hypothetical protein